VTVAGAQVVVAADYVRRLADRDAETEKHFAGHFGRLLRVLIRNRRRSWGDDLIEDVVQETFARVLTAVRNGTLRDADRFAAFMISVCENVLREATRGAARLLPSEPDRLDRPAPNDPEAQVAARRSLEVARVVLSSLPERDREILEMVLVQGADKDEVCRRFAVTRDHLRVLLHRARERFSKLLALQPGGREP
jgi:RNA polymerase sigma-70 factor, ECF subfamily